MSRRSKDRHRTGSPFPNISAPESLALALVGLAFVATLVIAYQHGLSRRTVARESEPSVQVAQAEIPVSPASAPVIGPTYSRPMRGMVLPERLVCAGVRIVDGDTLKCGSTSIRLASIDAPELPGHCARGRACVSGDPFSSTEHLRQLVGARELLCRPTDIDRYGRTVAFCEVGGQDLSCAQVQSGHAIIRYGKLSCP